MSPKASTFGLLVATQVIDSDSVPLLTNAGDNKRVSIAEMRSVVGPGWSTTINAALFAGATDELKIQAAIDYAAANSFDRVFIPTSLMPYDAALITFSTAVQMVREGGSFDVYDVQAYGAAGDGVTNDTAAILAAFTIAAVPTSTRRITFPYGTYQLPALSGLTVPDDCLVELGGSTLNITSLVDDTVVAFDMGNRSTLQHGTIALTVASPPGNGERNIPVRVGRYETGNGAGKSFVKIEGVAFDCTNLWTDSNAIAIFGSSRNCTVRNCDFTGNDRLGRAVLVHWSGDNTITPTTTTHPLGITIESIRVTDLYTASTSFGVFLSGTGECSVRDLSHAGQGGGVRLYAGDHSSEFASAADQLRVGRGFVLERIISNESTLGCVVLSGAPGIAGSNQPMQSTINGCAGVGNGSGSAGDGISFGSVDGVLVVGGAMAKFRYGLLIGKDSTNIVVQGGTYETAELAPIRVSNPANPAISKPLNVRLMGVTARGGDTNGAATSNNRACINIEGAVDCIIDGATLGKASGETALYGIRATTDSLRPRLYRNHCLGLVAGGVCYSIGASTDYTIEAHGIDNTGDAAWTLRGGVPLFQTFDAGAALAVYARAFYGTAAPTTGAWNRGDRVYRTDPSAAGKAGWICTTAGTPGTWKEFGVIDA